jgi:2',3'-cyclic-nucleotide 2'-phosphodiesterase / 3'-nucleotidase / 5'-nucleotidase
MLNTVARRICISLVSACALLSASVVEARVKDIAPAADAQVASGATVANTNYGTSTSFFVQSANTQNTFGDERAWLRFNLSDQIPAGATLTGAKLRIYNFDADAQGDDLTIAVHDSSTDTWTESTITWNNQPAFTATPLGTRLLDGPNEFLWYDIDVSSFVQSQWSGDKVVTLVVKAQTEGDSQWKSYRFDTREFGTNLAPRLRLEYTGEWPTTNGLDIIHFNDIHARVFPHDYDFPEGATDTPVLESTGGAAYLVSKVLELKQAKPDALILGGGDYSEGSPVGDLDGNRGVVEVLELMDQKLKALGGRGYDAELVGNHDVRYRSLVTNAKNSIVPFLSVNLLCGLDGSGNADPTCPNVVAAEAGQQVPYFTPYITVTTGGKKVGIIGYSTDDSSHLGTVAEVGAAEATEFLLKVGEVRWSDTDPDTINLKDWVELLRKPIAEGGEGCDVVIMLSHVGHRRLNATDQQLLGDTGDVAPPDLVVSGHWHTTTATAWQPANLNYNTTNVEAASYAQYVGEVALSADGRYISSIKHPIRTGEITPDADVVNLLTTLEADYNASAGSCVLDPAGPTNIHPCDIDRVVGYSAVDLRLDKDKWFTHSEFPWSGDNTAGEWVADAMLWKSNALGGAPVALGTLAIQSGGGIRRDVKAGDITYGDIYEVYPWQDDEMVRVQMTGQQIWDYLESHYVGSSISKDWVVTAQDGEITGITYLGTPVVLTGTYNVLISEYMYTYDDWISESGSDINFSTLTPTYLNVRIRDSVVEYTAQFPNAGTPLTVPGPRYVLDTEFAGTFKAVVTMVNDAETQPYFEAVFVRLLEALPETLARRNSYGLSTLVNSNGTINQDNRYREIMLYRSHLGFLDGFFKPGDIIEVKGEGGFFSGNPQLVDQEGVIAAETEHTVLGNDPTLALPTFYPSFTGFWDNAHENHLVKVRVTRVSDTDVRDAEGTIYPMYKEGGFFSVVQLPGANGDTLEIVGVQTQRDADRRFRLREATVVTGFPPSSAVTAITPVSQTVAPIALTATASDLNAYVPPAVGGTALVTWVTTGLAGNEASLNATSVAASITGAPIIRSAGIAASSAGGSLSSNGWDDVAGTNEYFEFGFTVAGGSSVDLTALTITTRSSGTGPGTMGLYYNGDGYTTPLYTFTQPNAIDLDSVVDISALPDLSGTVTFRIREIGNTQADGSGATASGGTFRVRTSTGGAGITINGNFVGSGGSGGSGGSTSVGTVTQVDFYSRKSTDGGLSYGAWTLAGTDAAGPAWTYSFNPTGYGLYQFYSIATDSDGSVEPAPVYADTSLSFTSLPPAAPINPSIADGATGVTGVSSIGVTVSDPDSATVTVCFYQVGNPDVLIGCASNVPSGSVASVAWTGLADNTSYQWYAIATDDAGVQTQSSTFGFTTGSATVQQVPALNTLAQVLLLMLLAGIGLRWMVPGQPR